MIKAQVTATTGDDVLPWRGQRRGAPRPPNRRVHAQAQRPCHPPPDLPPPARGGDSHRARSALLAGEGRRRSAVSSSLLACGEGKREGCSFSKTRYRSLPFPRNRQPKTDNRRSPFRRSPTTCPERSRRTAVCRPAVPQHPTPKTQHRRSPSDFSPRRPVASQPAFRRPRPSPSSSDTCRWRRAPQWPPRR